MFLFFVLYHLCFLEIFIFARKFGMGSFWILILAPIRSSLSLKIRRTHAPVVGRADKGYHLSALVVGFPATSYSFDIRLTAKTVDEDPASYKRWIYKKRSNHKKY